MFISAEPHQRSVIPGDYKRTNERRSLPPASPRIPTPNSNAALGSGTALMVAVMFCQGVVVLTWIGLLSSVSTKLPAEEVNVCATGLKVKVAPPGPPKTFPESRAVNAPPEVPAGTVKFTFKLKVSEYVSMPEPALENDNDPKRMDPPGEFVVPTFVKVKVALVPLCVNVSDEVPLPVNAPEVEYVYESAKADGTSVPRASIQPRLSKIRPSRFMGSPWIDYGYFFAETYSTMHHVEHTTALLNEASTLPLIPCGP